MRPTAPTAPRRSLLAVLCLLAGAAATAPAEQAEPPKNLQVLPKDTPRKDVVQLMRGFSFSLGVRCDHCHAAAAADPKAPPKGPPPLDFASDAKEAKQTARAMMKMVAVINQQHLAKLPVPATIQVDCATCHRGIPKPQSIDGALEAELQKKDAAAAVALYRELRKKFHGAAAYDFSETPLNRLGERLEAKEKGKEAAAIMELNAELNAPLSGWGMHVLAMAHLAAGEKEKAKDDYRKILAQKPDDAQAKKQLEALEAPAK